MSELRSVLDALAVDDLHDLSDGQVLERVALLVAVVNRANAELTRTVRVSSALARFTTATSSATRSST